MKAKTKAFTAFFITVAILLQTATLFCHAAPLSLSAQSAVLMDFHSGAVLYESNARQRMGMASTTKLMTALTVVRLTDTDLTVTVSKDAVGIEGSSLYLFEGERLTVEELLYGLLLSSANDAAAALAIFCSGSIGKFADEMNNLAAELGLEDTHFVNPHGLYDEDHYTTAYDLGVIAREVLKNDLLRKICATYKAPLPLNGEAGGRLAVNHNKLLRSYDGAIGMKTGFTKKTGRCLVSAAERGGLTLICVTLNAPDDWRDHTAMLDYGYENFERRVIAEAGKFEYGIPVTGGVYEQVTLRNESALILTMPKNSADVEYLVESSHRFLYAPVTKDTLCGRVTVTFNDQSASSALRAGTDVEAKRTKKSFLQRIADIFKD